MEKQIVIAQQGWVFVGDVTRSENEIVIENGAVVRRWGTTRGLGQLAQSGPTESTIMDPCTTTMHIPMSAVIATINCKPWPL